MRISSVVIVTLLLSAVGCATRGDYNTAQSRIDQQREVIEGLQGELDRTKMDLTRTAAERDRYRAEAERLDTESAAYATARAKLERRIAELGRALGGGEEGSDVAVTELPGGGYQLTVAERVLFATGDAGLSDEGRAVLDKVAALLKGGSGPIEIVGHTDNVPIARPETRQKFPRGNLELSIARSLSVADHLIQKGGLAPARIRVSGEGEHHPVASNANDDGRRKNRRVEIRVPSGE